MGVDGWPGGELSAASASDFAALFSESAVVSQETSKVRILPGVVCVQGLRANVTFALFVVLHRFDINSLKATHCWLCRNVEFGDVK